MCYPWMGKPHTLVAMLIIVLLVKRWHKHIPRYVMGILAFTIDLVFRHLFPIWGICQMTYVFFFPWLSLMFALAMWLSVFWLIETLRYYVILPYILTVSAIYFFTGMWFSHALYGVAITVFVSLTLAGLAQLMSQ
ncbi:MAG: hypothetical protein GXO59_03110 [Dictyoglomi bacterium]|nr:hypothetical protein [Dictyoglomota bacterium]